MAQLLNSGDIHKWNFNQPVTAESLETFYNNALVMIPTYDSLNLYGEPADKPSYIWLPTGTSLH